MSENLLEPAAFVSLGIGVVALFIRLGGRQLQGQLRVLRFRRKLRGLDDVVSLWERQLGSNHPAAGMPRELARRERQDRRPPQS